MARVWSCGFELQSTTLEWETTVGTVAISTSTVRSGAAALRCNPTAGTGYIQHSILAADDAAAHYYQRVYLRIASMPTARTTILSWSDGSGWIGADLDNAGKLLINGAPTTSTPTLTTGVWYRLELDYDDGANIATVYLDGTQVLQQTAYDLGGGAKVRIGPHDTTTCDLFFDDYAVNDGSGATQNGLPGAGKIVHLWPDSAGDNNGFATAVGGTAGAANNYTRVDEFPPDDATSYNNTTATGTTTIDDFGVTDSATAGIGGSDSITLVQVGQRAGSSAVTTASIVTRIKGQASGTTTESASIPVNTTAWNTHRTTAPKIHQITSYVNPQTSTAWTSSTLDTMQIGYRGNVSQTTQRRITTIWALVEFVPSTGTATVGTAALAASAAATARKVVAATGRCCVAASATATVRKVSPVTSGARAAALARAAAAHVTPASGRAVAATSATATAKHVATNSARAVAAGTATATSAKVVAAAGTAVLAATGTAVLGARVASGRCTIAATARVTAVKVTRAAGAAAAAPCARVVAVHRTPAAGTSVLAGTTRSTVVHRTPALATALAALNARGAATKRTAATGAASAATLARCASSKRAPASSRSTAAFTATGLATRPGEARAAAGRCVAVFAAYRIAGRRITPRPVAGTTARPSTGTTVRPSAGITYRP